MNLEKSISNLSHRLDRICPEAGNDTNYNDGIRYWKGKKIIPLDQWFQVKKAYNLKAALQFFPNDYPRFGLPCAGENIQDAKLKEDVDKWYSEYKNLMEYRRNPTYGNEKCFRCLLSPAREQSKLFFGINIIIARALERRYSISSSPTSPSIYPCPVLNIFECPYAADNTNKEEKEAEGDETVTGFDTSDLFDLSEIAFRLELALTRAQVMTRSNDTIYEADFENDNVRKIGYFSDAYDLCADDPLEEKLAEIERLSKVAIRNSDDIYYALTDRETLDKVLEQGLDEEHQQYKEEIMKLCMSLKDCIQEDLFEASNSNASYTNNSQRQQQPYAECSICQQFANIHCVNCQSDIWLCTDHWKLHKEDKHNSGVLLD